MIPRVLSAIGFMQSICSDYEPGLIKKIPFSMHRMGDFVAATFVLDEKAATPGRRCFEPEFARRHSHSGSAFRVNG